MSTQLSPTPVFKGWANDGTPLAYGLLYTYAAGTTTPQATYVDSTQTTPNTNPIILNARGECPLWLVEGEAYKLNLTDLSGNQIAGYPVDNILVINAATLPIDSINIHYDITAAEIAASVTPVNYAYAPGDVRRYGITGSGDETTKLQNALTVQQDVFIPSGITVHTTSAVNMLSNQALYGLGVDSAISCNGTTTNAVNMNAISHSVVRDLFVKCVSTFASGNDSAAVIIQGASTYCEVFNCRLEGTRAGVTIASGNYCVINKNQITSANSADTCWDIAIYGQGSHNRITNNLCQGGVGNAAPGLATNGIYMLISGSGARGDYNIFANNEVDTHTCYGILVYVNIGGGAGSSHTIVSGNHIHDITGTYVSGTASFGAGVYITTAEWVTVIGNTVFNTNVNTVNDNLAPGAIGINGTSCFTVQGNVIRSPVWYGIYVVNDGNLLGGGVIEGNIITGCLLHAGIRLNTVNNVALVANQVFGVACADDGIIVQAAAGSLIGIMIANNRISGFSTGSVNGIHVLNCQSPKVTGNHCNICTNGYQVDSCTSGDFSGNESRNSTTYDFFFGSSCNGPMFFDRNCIRGTATNGVQDTAGALYYGLNDISGQTNQLVAGNAPIGRTLATSATPSVANQRLMYYGGATAVTDLLNPTPGQIITIISTGTPTFKYNTGAAATKLILNGAVDFVMANNNTLTLEYPPGGPWIETGRKV